ncbi:hypothetical protein [Verrucomicrobium spinosum]|uniref:hypothetical protein n=1 Tax=Verrucomicrobium spinosum TaxID=2736 RepID=UPI0009464C4C|nr:hypothetical protein [Verrucomicrobium spinosum]
MKSNFDDLERFRLGMLELVGIVVVLLIAAVYHESVLGRLKIREKGHTRELRHQNEMREAFYWEDMREDWQTWKRIEALEARLKELEMAEPRMEDSGCCRR